GVLMTAAWASSLSCGSATDCPVQLPAGAETSRRAFRFCWLWSPPSVFEATISTACSSAPGNFSRSWATCVDSASSGAAWLPAGASARPKSPKSARNATTAIASDIRAPRREVRRWASPLRSTESAMLRFDQDGGIADMTRAVDPAFQLSIDPHGAAHYKQRGPPVSRARSQRGYPLVRATGERVPATLPMKTTAHWGRRSAPPGSLPRRPARGHVQRTRHGEHRRRPPLEQFTVLLDRRLQALHPVQTQEPQPQTQGEVLVQSLLQIVVVRGAVHAVMDPLVQPDQVPGVQAAVLGTQVRDQVRGHLQIVLVGPVGRLPRGEPLE